MFGAMRVRIFMECVELVLQILRKLRIDIYLPEWSLPRTVAHDRKWMAHAGVVRAHQNTAGCKVEFCEDCAGNVARIHVTGVRNHATKRRDWSLARREVGLNVGEQSFGIPRIKAASDRWLANVHHTSLALAGMTARSHLQAFSAPIHLAAHETGMRSSPMTMPRLALWVLPQPFPGRCAERPAHTAI